jgi:hypothetical protein
VASREFTRDFNESRPSYGSQATAHAGSGQRQKRIACIRHEKATKQCKFRERHRARRLRELAVGMEEYSRRGSNQRMRPKRARKPDNFKPLVFGQFQAGVDSRSARPA